MSEKGLPAKSIQRRNISQEQFFRVCMWLSNKQEMLVQDAPPMTELAQSVGNELKFEVAPNVINRAIAATGLVYKPKIFHPKHSKFKAKLAEMEAKINDLQTAISRIEAEFKGKIDRLEADGAVVIGIVRQMANEMGFVIKGEPQKAKEVSVLKGVR